MFHGYYNSANIRNHQRKGLWGIASFVRHGLIVDPEIYQGMGTLQGRLNSMRIHFVKEERAFPVRIVGGLLAIEA